MSIARQVTRINYDRLSRWYDSISGSSERPARMRGLHMLDIQPGERVLEIGCGTGEALFETAARVGPAGWVLGLDLSAGMLRVARNKLSKGVSPSVIILQGDGGLLPLPRASVDVIFMSFTLELFSAAEIPFVLLECWRVLGPGGRMGVVSLLKKEEPGWMDTAYTWAHDRWPQIIDCQPIPLYEMLKSARFTVSDHSEISMWGLTVGIAVVSKSLEC